VTGAALTFYGVLALSPLFALWLYPGVKKHAASRRDSALAAVMASTLFCAGLALFAAWVVNAVGVLLGR
jgi:hypothetical protein